MAELACLLRRLHPSQRLAAAAAVNLNRYLHSSSDVVSHLLDSEEATEAKGKWLALPPFSPPIDASNVGKALAGRSPIAENGEPTTALKWVRRCCPRLPVSLVHKLFRLRKVRKDAGKSSINADTSSFPWSQNRRVSAKEVLNSGEVILLPMTVQNQSPRAIIRYDSENELESSVIRSLELYKDEAIIAINKPPGMPVQGGVGIKYSMDEIAARCLTYEYPEPPRLVHRLDRDSSGVLLLARTQDSACILHSLFREKTCGAFSEEDIKKSDRALQRKYLALVIGTPKHSKGLISAPLAKVLLEDGKSERITIAHDTRSIMQQHALTEYRVIKASNHGGFTWIELWPLTGRKHQLRIHCAEVLGTPIVGDYKYGWQAHKKWEPIHSSESKIEVDKLPKQKLPFDLKSDVGSISARLPGLHLHCKQMVLPNISTALEHLKSASAGHDLSKTEKISLVAPLPLHMQTSWDFLNSYPQF